MQKEKEENIWRKKISFLWRRRKGENIWRRFFVEEKEKEEIIRRGEIFFVEEMKNGLE